MMNLLGIVGRAGSGKDTVADILVRDHGFVKVACADPLKRICRDTYGFTDSQLWGPSMERNKLDLRYPREHTSTLGGYCDCCGIDLRLEREAAETQCYLTARHALQQLGTEWGRRCYNNTWIDYAIRVASFLLSGEMKTSAPPLIPTYYPQTGSEWRSIRSERTFSGEVRGEIHWARGERPDRVTTGVVISDVRFPNEVDAIRAVRGRLWKTVHGGGLCGPAGEHESESHIDKLDVNVVVPDSPLEALPSIVADMLKGRG